MYATAWRRSFGLTLVTEYSRLHRSPSTLPGCRLAAYLLPPLSNWTSRGRSNRGPVRIRRCAWVCRKPRHTIVARSWRAIFRKYSSRNVRVGALIMGRRANVDQVRWKKMRWAGMRGRLVCSTLDMTRQRSVNGPRFRIPTLKSGPSEPLRFKRSVLSGPRLRRGKSACRTCLPHGLLNQPPLRRARVCLESLGTGEPDGVLEERPRGRAVIDAEPRPHAQECVDREPARRARRPTGRQHVIRSRAVVAQDFGGSCTDEQRAVMPQPGRHGGRAPELELQVLRCNRVARRDPFV